MYDGQISWLAKRGMFFLAVTNSLCDYQLPPRQFADRELIDLGIGLVTLDGYDGADRPHVIAPVGEDVRVVDFFRPGRVAVCNPGPWEPRFPWSPWGKSPPPNRKNTRPKSSHLGNSYFLFFL